MEIGESFFWKNHGKLAHLRILAPKIFHDHNTHKNKKMSLTKRFIPILSFWEWEVWISSEIYARLGPVIHEDQLSVEPIEELRSPTHLFATT